MPAQCSTYVQALITQALEGNQEVKDLIMNDDGKNEASMKEIQSQFLNLGLNSHKKGKHH